DSRAPGKTSRPSDPRARQGRRETRKHDRASPAFRVRSAAFPRLVAASRARGTSPGGWVAAPPVAVGSLSSTDRRRRMSTSSWKGMRLRVQARPVPSEPFAVRHRCAGDGTGKTAPERGQEDFPPVHRRGAPPPPPPPLPAFGGSPLPPGPELPPLLPPSRAHPPP